MRPLLFQQLSVDIRPCHRLTNRPVLSENSPQSHLQNKSPWSLLSLSDHVQPGKGQLVLTGADWHCD